MRNQVYPFPPDWLRPTARSRSESKSGLALHLDHSQNGGGARHVDEVCWRPAKPQLDNMKDATVMLAAVQAGDRKAAEQLLVLVYDELRRLAASKLALESPGQTLQPTALVHEAWLRLVGDQNP